MVILSVVALLYTTSAVAELKFHWPDSFENHHKTKLVSWISQTNAGLTQLVGPLPFTTHIYFHRTDNAREPVPWAHTQRSPMQAVHFYVDPAYPLQDFLDDWTAPHELSHLVLPYVGENYAWFAEGFASYMQYQVMIAMGVLNEQEAAARYKTRFQRAAGRYDLPSLPFAEAASVLRSRGQYPTLYWGGAVYFWQVDTHLQTSANTSLIASLRTYVQCCRQKTRQLTQLLKSLDDITQSSLFSERMKHFETQLGFPIFPL